MLTSLDQLNSHRYHGANEAKVTGTAHVQAREHC